MMPSSHRHERWMLCLFVLPLAIGQVSAQRMESAVGGNLSIVPVAPQPVVPDAFVTKSWQYLGFGFIADVDNDGRQEILNGLQVSSNATPALTYRSVLGSGDWQQGPYFLPSGPQQPGAFAIYRIRATADVDGNGGIDILTDRWLLSPGPARHVPSLWMGSGQGSFVEDPGRLPASQANVRDAEFLDMDGDGDLDLFLCTITGCFAYTNDGTGHFTDESTQRIAQPPGIEGSRCAVVDADHDGRADVFVVCGFGGRVGPTLLYLDQGGGHYLAVDQGVTTNGLEVLTPDVDGDGHRDVLAIYFGPPVLFLSRAGQSILPQAPSLLPASATLASETSLQVDFDLDGDDDVLLDGGSTLLLLENTGTRLVVARAPAPTIGPRGVGDRLVLDYDLDGDPDLIMGGLGSNALLLSNTYREARTIQPPVRGGAFEVGFLAQPNHLVANLLSWGAARFLLPGIGWVMLDPNQAIAGPTCFYPWAMEQSVSFPIPQIPSLAGMPLGVQGLDIDVRTGLMQATNRPWEIVQ